MIKEIYRAFLSCDQNITSDTRKISPNCIFFALKGHNFNGNKFVSEAIHKGASYAVTDDESAEIVVADSKLEIFCLFFCGSPKLIVLYSTQEV